MPSHFQPTAATLAPDTGNTLADTMDACEAYAEQAFDRYAAHCPLRRVGLSARRVRVLTEQYQARGRRPDPIRLTDYARQILDRLP